MRNMPSGLFLTCEQNNHVVCKLCADKSIGPDCNTNSARGALWLSGRASDSGATGRGFETYLRRVVSLSKTLYTPKVLVIPRKR